jgi:predicted  nucleic acid-binding Zn-ribbon protein
MTQTLQTTNDLKIELERSKAETKAAKDESAALALEVEKAHGRIASLTAEVEGLETQLSAANAELADPVATQNLRAKVERIEAAFAQVRAAGVPLAL